jgi:class 3 adenylate cyclase
MFAVGFALGVLVVFPCVLGYFLFIRAVDRYIWSAIGNTTNLAARLERLTRDLDVAIAIDAATRERAGEAAAGFLHHPEVRIRGRSEPVDVYALAQLALERGTPR